MTGREFWNQALYALEERAASDRMAKRRLALLLSDGVGSLLSRKVPAAEEFYRAWAGLGKKHQEGPSPKEKLKAAWQSAKASEGVTYG